ncbi:MAG: hypothetical protein EOO46_01425 [Flavobacterium sp.]|nr:MAG: hypothetical protein EOO46_01425 [Flavobacterium sp.]
MLSEQKRTLREFTHDNAVAIMIGFIVLGIILYGMQQKPDASCEYEDGLHPATVDYYNPETGREKTYSLEVEVEDCEVITIYFPKGGWLDSDHLYPEQLDRDGSATLEDDRGRTFDVQID